MPTAEVIKQLSLVIRGWCNYYRYAVAKRRFGVLDHHIWQITYKWAKHRHPRKNRRWVVNHYTASTRAAAGTCGTVATGFRATTRPGCRVS